MLTTPTGKNKKRKSKKDRLPKGALVIGGGISGIQAALDLADAGIMTYVIELSTTIGGRMAQLDKTFPTNDCAMCILSPKLVAAARHPNIRLITNSEVSSVTGTAGDFKVQVTKHPRFIDENKCVGCGDCAAKCPVKVSNEFDLGLGIRKAIYVPFPQAVPMVYCIDQDNCLYLTKGKCGVCAKICKADAIEYEQQPEKLELDIGAIIVATGYEQFDPSGLVELGYSRIKDVITGLEFERLLNASGPTNGKILRPSDGKTPKNLLFIQCVGSRDIKHAKEYCSRICCMYAIKEAVIAKEHEPGLEELTILNMEIRAYGKGFEEYYQRAINDGIKFIKGRPAEINEDFKKGKVMVSVEDITEGTIKDLETDLVVLSSAVVPSKSNQQLAETLQIDLDEHGFFKECSFPGTASESSKEGIFLSGCAQGPKDIPDSVAQGSAAAAMVERYLKDSRTQLEPTLLHGEIIQPESKPELRSEKARNDHTDVVEPRVGLFVCHCGINIAGVLDVPALVKYGEKLPGVVFATDNLYTCSDDAQKYIQDMIKEHNLTRVVVASCTPRTHEPIFKDTCARAGLNPYLFEMTNIRDQCSWVHINEPQRATEKAKDLIKMAVARAQKLRPLKTVSTPIEQAVTVIGGGIAGMQCAIDLANQGIRTTLIEQQKELGGRLKQLNKLAYGEISPQKLINNKVQHLKSAGVTLYNFHKLVEINGYVGNFELVLESLDNKIYTNKSDTKQSNKKSGQSRKEKKEKQIKLLTGAIVLAIGSDLVGPDKTKEFGYGIYKNVVSNLEFENILKESNNENKKILNKNIIFLQCIGAREQDNSNESNNENVNVGQSVNTGCSRYCCQTALHQAIQAAYAGANVTILHRGIRAFSKYAEELYYKAGEAGVKFIQFPDETKNAPKITKNGSNIKVLDISLNQELILPADIIVLTLAMVPKERETEQLQKWLKVPRSADGFFLELHPKLAPVETNTTGIYVCGCAQGPKDIVDTCAQASAAAAKAAVLVSNRVLEADPVTAVVNETVCWGCGTCEDLCAYGAPHVDKTENNLPVSKINSALCKGCGVCASNCPSGAISIMHFTNEQIESMIRAFGKVAN